MTDDDLARGHRQRLREKFIRAGLSGFHDYEIVELLLTLGTPRKDCKTPAKLAIEKFGSLRGVLEASPEDLGKIKGIGPNNVFGLKLVRDLSRHYLSERIEAKEFLKSSQAVVDYLKVSLRDRVREVFMVVFLNGRNQILSSEELFEGTLNTSAVYPREVVKRTLANNAAAVVFVHNHPSGNTHPSQEDLQITEKLKAAMNAVDVVVHDHIIIAGETHFSFADHGLL
ncbi:MAG: DNA repair protein RadC [Fidelibacterota bacterium]